MGERINYNSPEMRAKLADAAVPGISLPWLGSLADKFRGLTPQQKQEVLNAIFEMGLGTAGAVAGGGVMSIPGAGAGATLGKITAEKLGPYLGGSGAPQRSGAEEAKDLGKTFALNAAGEGAGRYGIPMAWAAAKNLAKMPFRPTARAQQVSALMDQLGIPQDLAERSGKEWLLQLRTGMAHVPISSGVIMKARRNAWEAWEGYLDSVGDQLHQGAVSKEDFQNLVQQGLEKARSAFSNTVQQEFTAAASRTHPAAQSAKQVREGLQGAQKANVATLHSWADQAYGDLGRRGENSTTDLTDWSKRAADMLDQLSPEAQHYLSGKNIGLLQSASDTGARTIPGTAAIPGRLDVHPDLDAFAKSIAGKRYADLSPDEQKAVMDLAPKMGVQAPPPTAISATPASPAQRIQDARVTTAQAMEIRKALSDMQRSLRATSSGDDKYIVGSLLDNLDDAIVTQTSDRALARDFQDVNAKFRQGVQAVREPRVKGRGGNPEARQLRTTAEDRYTESLVGPFKQTTLQNVDLATNPQSMGHIVDVPAGTPDAMGPLRRYGAERIRQQGTVQGPWGGERLSPQAVAQHMETPGQAETYQELFGPDFYKFKDLGRPDLQAQENELFRSRLARTADNPSSNANAVFAAAFPPRAPEVAGQTMNLLTDKDAGSRAFFDAILQASRSRSGPAVRTTGIGDRDLINPGALEKRLADYGETAPRVLGNAMPDLQTGLRAGRAMTEPEIIYGNPSGTAGMYQTLQWAGKGLDLLTLPFRKGPLAFVGTAAKYGVEVPAVYGAAKFMTNPKTAKALTAPTHWVSAAGSPTGGFFVRGLMDEPNLDNGAPPPAAPAAAPPIPGLDAPAGPPPIPGLDLPR